MDKSELSPWRVRFGAIALLLSVFTAGGVAGAALYRWARLDACTDAENGPPPPGGPWRMLQALQLNEEQTKQAQAIFERHKPRLDAILHDTFPKVRAVQEEIDAELVKLFTPEQRRQFDAMKQHRGPPRGGPPMGTEPFGRGGPPMGTEPFGHGGPPMGTEPFGRGGPMGERPPDLPALDAPLPNVPPNAPLQNTAVPNGKK